MKIAFITEGNHKQGMGDITSSLALADEFVKSGFRSTFILSDSKAPIELIESRGNGVIYIENKKDIPAYLDFHNINTVIFNKLKNDPVEIQRVQKENRITITIDDNGPAAKLASLSFNPLYFYPDTFHGFEYLTLNHNYQDFHKKGLNLREKPKEVIITQGGSDTYGFTPFIVEELLDLLNSFNITVILGPNFSHNQELETVLNNMSDIKIVENPKSMIDLQSNSDIAITAAGFTLFEFASLGIPSIVVCGEPFEEETAIEFEKKGGCINLGFGKNIIGKSLIKNSLLDLSNNLGKYHEMQKRCFHEVDGLGSERIVRQIISHFSEL